jgi:hypothetical protein
MRTEEDEAFDDLARKQGAWGGGFKAKQAMAADKQHWNEDEWRRNNWRCGHGWLRGEQCEICNAPQPAQEQCQKHGECFGGECIYPPAQEPVALVIDGVLVKSALPEKYTGHLYTTPPQPAQEPYDQTALELCEVCGWKTLIPDDGCLNCERKEKPIQQEALYGMNQDDWKDVVAAITKVRDGRGIYLGCRPADVFQEWFLALGTAKVKEKNND